MRGRLPDEHGVDDGTRTRDVLDHNQVLYQLNYIHHHAQRPAQLAPRDELKLYQRKRYLYKYSEVNAVTKCGTAPTKPNSIS